MGAFLCALLGAFAGATGVFSDSLKFLPISLFEQQGKLLGSIFFGLLGCAAGFLLIGAASFLSAIIINFILSMIGGLKMNVGQKSAAPAGETKMSDDPQDNGLGFNLKD
jgi:hypothetical protein